MSAPFSLTIRVWRQPTPHARGGFETYQLTEVSEHMSFLEMLDVLNEQLLAQGIAPIAFDHDCREGICGACSMMINGRPHGPQQATTACQLHMRHFAPGDTVVIEPWRASPFPVIRDLVVDRSALDRIIQAGGYISIATGSAPEANGMLIPREAAERAMDAAACIGCGACVAACPNASAMLFTAAKASHLGLLPQGQPERATRALAMVGQMDREGFGGCTNFGECQEACPKGIDVEVIAELNRDYRRASLAGRESRANGQD